MIPLVGSAPTIPRHRTAMSRPELSRPLRLALDTGLIEQRSCVFDYGCGRGDDLRGLEASGIRCFGWDPVFCPTGPRRHRCEMITSLRLTPSLLPPLTLSRLRGEGLPVCPSSYVCLRSPIVSS